MGQPQLAIATVSRGDDRLPGGELLVQAGEGQHVALLETVVVAGVGELQRQDAEVRQFWPWIRANDSASTDPQAQIRGA